MRSRTKYDYRKYIAIVAFLCTKPQWGIQRIKQRIRQWKDRWHKKRVVEYNNCLYSFEDAITSVTHLQVPEIKKLRASASVAELKQYISDAISHVSGPSFPLSSCASFILGEACYIVCRALKPKVVIETGVAYGITTAFILKALEENQQGILYSVDLPLPILGYKKSVGLAVPPQLKERWRLHIGAAEHVLPGILKTVTGLGIFVRDSHHTYASMLREFEIVWPYLNSGGLIISDDADINDALLDFAGAKKVTPVMIPQPEKQVKIGMFLK